MSRSEYSGSLHSVALLIVALAQPLIAAPATQPSADRIDALVAKLSDKEWTVRQQAQSELEGMGEPATPLLKARLAGVTDPEAHNAIESILAGIKRARDTGPTLVTIQQKGAPFEQLLDAFTEQSGLEFTAPNPPQRAIDFDVSRAPMWQALLDACAKGGMAFRSIDARRIVLEPIGEGGTPTPVSASGPFMVTIARAEVNVSRAVVFGGPKPMNVVPNAALAPPCRLSLFGWNEPRLRLLRWSIDSVEECVTDTGDQLTMSARVGLINRVGGQANARSETQLALSAPPAAARKLASLKMTVRFVVQGELDRLELPNPLALKNSAHAVGDMSVVIKNVKKVAEGNYTYEVSVQRGGGRAPADWAMTMSMIQQFPCKLVDAEGTPLRARGMSTSSSGDQITMTNTVTCDGPGGVKTGEPAKLVWEFPSNLEQFVVPMEFHDVPLP